MKKKELYYDKIIIKDEVHCQLDSLSGDVHIYKNDELIYRFALNRKIYTFFKILQDITNDNDYVIVEDTKTRIYGKEIQLYDNISIKINANHPCLTLDFYETTADNKQLIYLIKLIYTTQKLFSYLLVPLKMRQEKNFHITNVFKFLDMLEILSLENNREKIT